jgi:hypothetical protein
METSLVKYENKSLLFDVTRFEHAQRVAKMLTSSTMVPEQFRGSENMGNCIIALNLADRLGLDPFMLMQKMYIIHGKPGIEAQLAIALINKSGKFSPLQFCLIGEGLERECTASATHLTTKEKCSQVVGMKMAQSEGWLSKSGSKWKTMPDLMLQYRSATFFARIYCPESLLGLQTSDEIYDIIDVTPEEKPFEKLKALKPAQKDFHTQNCAILQDVNTTMVDGTTLPEATRRSIEDAHDIDPVLFKKALIEIGTDSINGIRDEKQADRFLHVFKNMLDEPDNK